MSDLLKSDVQCLGLLLVELIAQVDALSKTVQGRNDLQDTYRVNLAESKAQIRRALPLGYPSQIGSGTLSTLETTLLESIRGHL